MNQQRQIQDLLGLGLTERESKVYLSLVQLGTATATDIMKIATVPKSKISEIMQKLIDKGLCIEKSHGYRKKYCAVDPANALGGLIKKREEEFAQLKTSVNQTIENLVELYQRPSRSESFEFVQILKNTDRIYELYQKMRNNTKKEILEFCKPPFLCPIEILKNEHIDNKKLIDKGVKIRLIHEFVITSNPDLKESIIKDVMNGVESRFVESLPLKMNVFDSMKVLIIMMDPMMLKPLPTSLLIEHSGLAATLRLNFFSIWENSIPYDKYFADK